MLACLTFFALVSQQPVETAVIPGAGAWQITLATDPITKKANLAVSSSEALVELGEDGRPSLIKAIGHECRARPLLIRIDENKAILLGEAGRRNVDLAVKQMAAGKKATLGYYRAPCKSLTYAEIDLQGFAETVERARSISPEERRALEDRVVEQNVKAEKAAIEAQMRTEPSTVLLDSARAGDIVRVLASLEAGADVNARSEANGYTALVWAAARGNLEVARRLIEARADLNAQAEDGQTALMRAADNGHVEMVQLLLDRGADVHVTADNEVTALELATLKGHGAVIELLRKAGAKP